jgi:hypothetical protein
MRQRKPFLLATSSAAVAEASCFLDVLHDCTCPKRSFTRSTSNFPKIISAIGNLHGSGNYPLRCSYVIATLQVKVAGRGKRLWNIAEIKNYEPSNVCLAGALMSVDLQLSESF